MPTSDNAAALATRFDAEGDQVTIMDPTIPPRAGRHPDSAAASSPAAGSPLPFCWPPASKAIRLAGDDMTIIDTEPGHDSALAKAGLRAVHGDPLVLTTLEAAGAAGHLAAEELFDQSWGVDVLTSPATALVAMIRRANSAESG